MSRRGCWTAGQASAATVAAFLVLAAFALGGVPAARAAPTREGPPPADSRPAGPWATHPDDSWTPAPATPPPADEPAERAAWIVESPWTWELGLTPAVGFDIRGLGDPERDFAVRYGGTVSVGFRYQTDFDEPDCGDSPLCIGPALGTALKGVAIGNQYGVDLRLHAFHFRDTTWLGFGLDPLALLVWGEPGDGVFERIRSMTIVGSAIPEVGVLFAPDGDQALVLRVVIPLSVLVTRHVGVEFRLSEDVVLPRERPLSFAVMFGLGVVFR